MIGKKFRLAHVMLIFRKIFILVLVLFIPLQVSAGEFLNTILHINFGLMYGNPYGNMINAEKDRFYITETDSDGTTTNVHPSHTDMGLGIMIDFAPFSPILLGNEAHALKFGARGGYRFHYLTQNISIRNSDKEEVDYGGDLIQYGAWMVGPVIHYAPYVEATNIHGDYTAIGGFTLFFLYGRFGGGKLTAFASERVYQAAVGGTVPTDFETTISGYIIEVGVGGEGAICSVNLGINVFYSYTNIELDQQIYSNVSKNTSIHQFCIEIYMGIPIEWVVFPRIF
ncbi:MAG: hypothetical protein GY754_33970 [bacterium]|nr:hypothetical protein [bacterium]